MHRIGRELRSDCVGPYQFRRHRQRYAVFAEAANRVLGREQAADAPRRIIERCGDGVPTVKNGGVARRAASRLCRGPKAALRARLMLPVARWWWRTRRHGPVLSRWQLKRVKAASDGEVGLEPTKA